MRLTISERGAILRKRCRSSRREKEERPTSNSAPRDATRLVRFGPVIGGVSWFKTPESLEVEKFFLSLSLSLRSAFTPYLPLVMVFLRQLSRSKSLHFTRRGHRALVDATLLIKERPAVGLALVEGARFTRL
jgi:hypothetical protein